MQGEKKKAGEMGQTGGNMAAEGKDPGEGDRRAEGRWASSVPEDAP